ncbi:MAG: glycosyl transferase [Anaerolineaceae bacterium]|nr:glycosyl transferase [Anaerolineaceae bacterium]
MHYGHFDDKNKEYVITTPKTPLPWINYLGSDEYFSLISNTAGGYTFYRDARLRRITRYRYNNVPYDQGGRYLYLRNNENGEFWSPSWQPTKTDLDQYTCRHGLGYSVISSEYKGIHCQTTYFVPLQANNEIWRTKIKNTTNQTVNLSLFSLVEFCLWDALDDSTNYQRNFNIGEVEVDNNVIYHKTEYRERRNHFSYFACSESMEGFDTDRNAFLGDYNGFESPQVVKSGKSNQSIAHGWAPIGSHHLKFELCPNEEKEIIFSLGYYENPVDQKFDKDSPLQVNKTFVKTVIEQFLDPTQLDTMLADLKSSWEKILNQYQVNSPDQDTNRMVNIWNAYQCMTTFNLSRSASYFESGIGRGMGFRDSNQDLLGFVQMAPEKARERLIDLASTQLPNGGAYHQYQPLTKRGNDAVGGDFNDDPLWLILAVAAYLKETGDKSILQAQIPYDNQPGTETPMFEHLQRAYNYTLERLGPHGLPLIGRADWNDCLNLNCFSLTPGESFQTTENKVGGVAESVFIAGLFILAGSELEKIALLNGNPNFAQQVRQHMSEMEKAIIEHGWDGSWFRRAYDYFGEVLGSQVNKEGKIFIEPQGICVMADIGLENGNAKKAMDSVHQFLNSDHGVVLLQPAFTQYDPKYGEITSYPPGYKENASVFCHTNPWVMIAETRLGRGDLAMDYYKKINPSAREKISDVHRCEPYVYAQTIAGKDAPTQGEAKNSWLTGTAAWNYVAITQYILGIRPDYDGLVIDPCIPADWPEFNVTRKIRNCVYEIQVHNPQQKQKGVTQITIDGKSHPIETKIPYFSDGLVHQVEVWLG